MHTHMHTYICNTTALRFLFELKLNRLYTLCFNPTRIWTCYLWIINKLLLPQPTAPSGIVFLFKSDFDKWTTHPTFDLTEIQTMTSWWWTEHFLPLMIQPTQPSRTFVCPLRLNNSSIRNLHKMIHKGRGTEYKVFPGIMHISEQSHLPWENTVHTSYKVKLLFIILSLSIEASPLGAEDSLNHITIITQPPYSSAACLANGTLCLFT